MTLRVLFVDASSCFGGAQRSLLSLLDQLQQHAVVPHLLCAEASGLAERCSVPVTRIPVGQWRRSLAGMRQFLCDRHRCVPLVRKQQLAHSADVVYANGLHAALLCARSAAPVVFHHRDHRCPRILLKLAAGRCARMLVVSHFLEAHCRKILSPAVAERLHTVHNGFDLARLEQQAGLDCAECDAIPADAIPVVLAADLVRWKRHDLFLRGFALAQAREPRLYAIVAGGCRDPQAEAYRQELAELTRKLGIEKQTRFTGYIDNVLPLIRNSRVLVSVSKDEPFGRSVVEALALGKPLVIAGEGGPAEICRDCTAALFVDEMPESIAGAILDRISCPDVSDAARQRAQQFTAQRYGEQVLKHLQS